MTQCASNDPHGPHTWFPFKPGVLEPDTGRPRQCVGVDLHGQVLSPSPILHGVPGPGIEDYVSTEAEAQPRQHVNFPSTPSGPWPTRAGREGDTQPLPESSDAPIAHEMVIDDLRARLELGIERYGQPLQAFNGRDSLQDAYEEILDLVVYLRNELYEKRERDQELDYWKVQAEITTANNTVEVGGEVMTQAQFNAARGPMLTRSTTQQLLVELSDRYFEHPNDRTAKFIKSNAELMLGYLTDEEAEYHR